ncbi:peptidoglycan/xylan/chitin deacetylase (PgdA/CDA1 family) [Motilibacter rhizosphaerae]|uniref:Peptidoglycan/xylan/chitin deacetylase (PgdA/CDA1 family) n=1 Tax=Motilibacter rhizosphaerae TaxID=598652 RepID=A0A4Q7NRL0_9ACTN|nr:polysaccharide deacetylase family protein [Motilibacter rhizosphaerae]RZS89707.1 peptidoglycan/xylan/chitin deacetylase (PgdA/CDA1 family) [Motilibacter rhizosphaerae]
MSAPWSYSPITARPAGRWPGGKRLAVYCAVGVEEYRFGDGHTEDLLDGVEGPDLVNTSWRDYGNRVGVFRLLDRLDALQVPPTLLWNTMVYDTAPDVAVAARKAGAEFVGHGISNSDSLAGLGDDEQRAYLAAVAERIGREEGQPPGGWSSPWLTHTPSTLDLLAGAGYDYLLDLRLDDQPAWLPTAGRPVLAIPYALELNDSTTQVGRRATAGDFADMVVDEFDELLAASADAPLVMSIVVHSFISGAPFRLRALTRALEHLAARADDVWFTQPRQIHEAWSRMLPAPSSPAGEVGRG